MQAPTKTLNMVLASTLRYATLEVYLVMMTLYQHNMTHGIFYQPLKCCTTIDYCVFTHSTLYQLNKSCQLVCPSIDPLPNICLLPI